MIEEEILAQFSTSGLRKNQLTRAAKKWNMDFDLNFRHFSAVEREEFLDNIFPETKGTPPHGEPPTDPRHDNPNTGTAEPQLGPRSPSDSGGAGDAKELPPTPERTSPRCEWCGEDLGDSDVDAMRG